MTRQQFIERFRHEFAGFVLDAYSEQRKGADAALWLRGIMNKIDTKLAVAFDEATKEESPVNGEKARK